VSYARFGKDSEVYLYDDIYRHYTCCGCRLEEGWDKWCKEQGYEVEEKEEYELEIFSTEHLSEYFYHIAQHLEVGQKVPLSGIVRLLAEWIHMQEDGHTCH